MQPRMMRYAQALLPAACNARPVRTHPLTTPRAARSQRHRNNQHTHRHRRQHRRHHLSRHRSRTITRITSRLTRTRRLSRRRRSSRASNSTTIRVRLAAVIERGSCHAGAVFAVVGVVGRGEGGCGEGYVGALVRRSVFSSASVEQANGRVR